MQKLPPFHHILFCFSGREALFWYKKGIQKIKKSCFHSVWRIGMQDAAILRFIDRLIRSWFFCVSGQCKENRIGARQKFIRKRSVIQSPIAISASPIKLRWDCFGCWEGPIIRICSIRGIFSENPIGKSVLHREGLNVGPSFNHDGSHKVHPFLDLYGLCLSTRAMEKQKTI